MDTPYVNYFVDFNHYDMGRVPGTFIEDKLNLKYSDGPFNIEVFLGDPTSAGGYFYLSGAMEVLEPYINDGKLTVRNKMIGINVTNVSDSEPEKAQAIMDKILAEYYTDAKLDAVLCENDSIARGVIASLEAAGYTEFPIITGHSRTKENIKLIKDGKQTMSVFFGYRILTSKTVEMVDAIIAGKKVPVNDSVNNDKIEIPAFLCSPVVVTADNYKEILIGGGYYTEAELEE